MANPYISLEKRINAVLGRISQGMGLGNDVRTRLIEAGGAYTAILEDPSGEALFSAEFSEGPGGRLLTDAHIPPVERTQNELSYWESVGRQMRGSLNADDPLTSTRRVLRKNLEGGMWVGAFWRRYMPPALQARVATARIPGQEIDPFAGVGTERGMPVGWLTRSLRSGSGHAGSVPGGFVWSIGALSAAVGNAPNPAGGSVYTNIRPEKIVKRSQQGGVHAQLFPLGAKLVRSPWTKTFMVQQDTLDTSPVRAHGRTIKLPGSLASRNVAVRVPLEGVKTRIALTGIMPEGMGAVTQKIWESPHTKRIPLPRGLDPATVRIRSYDAADPAMRIARGPGYYEIADTPHGPIRIPSGQWDDIRFSNIRLAMRGPRPSVAFDMSRRVNAGWGAISTKTVFKTQNAYIENPQKLGLPADVQYIGGWPSQDMMMGLAELWGAVADPKMLQRYGVSREALQGGSLQRADLEALGTAFWQEAVRNKLRWQEYTAEFPKEMIPGLESGMNFTRIGPGKAKGSVLGTLRMPTLTLDVLMMGNRREWQGKYPMFQNAHEMMNFMRQGRDRPAMARMFKRLSGSRELRPYRDMMQISALNYNARRKDSLRIPVKGVKAVDLADINAFDVNEALSAFTDESGQVMSGSVLNVLSQFIKGPVKFGSRLLDSPQTMQKFATTDMPGQLSGMGEAYVSLLHGALLGDLDPSGLRTAYKRYMQARNELVTGPKFINKVFSGALSESQGGYAPGLSWLTVPANVAIAGQEAIDRLVGGAKAHLSSKFSNAVAHVTRFPLSDPIGQIGARLGLVRKGAAGSPEVPFSNLGRNMIMSPVVAAIGRGDWDADIYQSILSEGRMPTREEVLKLFSSSLETHAGQRSRKDINKFIWEGGGSWNELAKMASNWREVRTKKGVYDRIAKGLGLKKGGRRPRHTNQEDFERISQGLRLIPPNAPMRATLGELQWTDIEKAYTKNLQYKKLMGDVFNRLVLEPETYFTSSELAPMRALGAGFYQKVLDQQEISASGRHLLNLASSLSGVLTGKLTFYDRWQRNILTGDSLLKSYSRRLRGSGRKLGDFGNAGGGLIGLHSDIVSAVLGMAAPGGELENVDYALQLIAGSDRGMLKRLKRYGENITPRQALDAIGAYSSTAVKEYLLSEQAGPIFRLVMGNALARDYNRQPGMLERLPGAQRLTQIGIAARRTTELLGKHRRLGAAGVVGAIAQSQGPFGRYLRGAGRMFGLQIPGADQDPTMLSMANDALPGKEFPAYISYDEASVLEGLRQMDPQQAQYFAQRVGRTPRYTPRGGGGTPSFSDEWSDWGFGGRAHGGSSGGGRKGGGPTGAPPSPPDNGGDQGSSESRVWSALQSLSRQTEVMARYLQSQGEFNNAWTADTNTSLSAVAAHGRGVLAAARRQPLPPEFIEAVRQGAYGQRPMEIYARAAGMHANPRLARKLPAEIAGQARLLQNEYPEVASALQGLMVDLTEQALPLQLGKEFGVSANLAGALMKAPINRRGIFGGQAGAYYPQTWARLKRQYSELPSVSPEFLQTQFGVSGGVTPVGALMSAQTGIPAELVEAIQNAPVSKRTGRMRMDNQLGAGLARVYGVRGGTPDEVMSQLTERFQGGEPLKAVNIQAGRLAANMAQYTNTLESINKSASAIGDVQLAYTKTMKRALDNIDPESLTPDRRAAFYRARGLAGSILARAETQDLEALQTAATRQPGRLERFMAHPRVAQFMRGRVGRALQGGQLMTGFQMFYLSRMWNLFADPALQASYTGAENLMGSRALLAQAGMGGLPSTPMLDALGAKSLYQQRYGQAGMATWGPGLRALFGTQARNANMLALTMPAFGAGVMGMMLGGTIAGVPGALAGGAIATVGALGAGIWGQYQSRKEDPAYRAQRAYEIYQNVSRRQARLNIQPPEMSDDARRWKDILGMTEGFNVDAIMALPASYRAAATSEMVAQIERRFKLSEEGARRMFGVMAATRGQPRMTLEHPGTLQYTDRLQTYANQIEAGMDPLAIQMERARQLGVLHDPNDPRLTGFADRMKTPAQWAGQQLAFQQYGAMFQTLTGRGVNDSIEPTLAAYNKQQRMMLGQVLSGNRIVSSALGQRLGIDELITLQTGAWGGQAGLPLFTQTMGRGSVSPAAMLAQLGIGAGNQFYGALLSGGLRAGEAQLRAVRYGSQLGNIAIQRSQLQYREGVLLPGMRGLQDTQLGLRRGFEDQQYQRQLARYQMVGEQFAANQDLTWRFQEENRRMRDRSLALQETQFRQRAGRQFAQFDMTDRLRSLQRGFTEERWGWTAQDMQLARSYTMEDRAFSRSQYERNWGWQASDLEEQIRRSTGYQRKLLMRQRDRATITRNETIARRDTLEGREDAAYQRQVQRFERQKEHQRELWKLEDERISKSREYYDQDRKFQEEMFRLRKENYANVDKLQKEQFDLRKSQFDEQRQLQKDEMDERRQLEEELRQVQDNRIKLQRESEDKSLGWSKAQLDNSAAMLQASHDWETALTAIKQRVEEINAQASVNLFDPDFLGRFAQNIKDVSYWMGVTDNWASTLEETLAGVHDGFRDLNGVMGNFNNGLPRRHAAGFSGLVRGPQAMMTGEMGTEAAYLQVYPAQMPQSHRSVGTDFPGQENQPIYVTVYLDGKEIASEMEVRQGSSLYLERRR